MISRATLSPAWLGIFAALSFGGLVIASFASGYHLVMKTAPHGATVASQDSPALSAAADPSNPGDAPNVPSGGDTGAVADGAASGGPASGGPATDGAAKDGPVKSRSAKRRRGAGSSAGSSDAAEAVVRPNLPPNRAVVRSRPETGGIVARLPSNQRVTVRGRQGQWLRVEFDRKGKHVQGWTLETNLQLR
ncbi:MAG TPA: SH3 domain-containing protein [Polyangiaceae bacterium]|nr:SH3 domain-containing protein [Polyangiaceae bacterium]